MRTTVNQLYAEQHAIQQGHLQLQKGEFFPGAFQRAVYERVVRYPLHCVYYNTGGINKRTNQITLFIIVADRVYKDYNNLNDTKSDTKQCVEDIVDIMTHSRRWNKIGRVESAPVSLFIDGKADEVTGHMATVTLTLFDRKALCDLPMLNYDFDGSLASRCEPVTVLDSDGETEVIVPAGSSFACTPVSPVTGQNSDGSYTFIAQSGDNVPLPDVQVNLFDGPQIFPSVKTINLPNYAPYTPPPTGSRIPVNVVTDPLTQVLWFGAGAYIATGTGTIEKTAGSPSGWNDHALFNIETMGDFEVEWKFGTGSDSVVGISFIDKSPYYGDFDFSIGHSGAYFVYERGLNPTNFNAPADAVCKIRVEGPNIQYFTNGVLRYTSAVVLQAVRGYMLFEATPYGVEKITDIKLTFL